MLSKKLASDLTSTTARSLAATTKDTMILRSTHWQACVAERGLANGWNDEAKKRAVYDFSLFLDGINKNTDIAIIGTSKSTFQSAWNNWKSGKDYANLTTEQARTIDTYKDSFRTSAIDDGTNRNSQLRREITNALYNETKGFLNEIQRANAQKGLTSPRDGDVSAAAISIIYDPRQRQRASQCC